jgi:ribosomal protein S18 acetylase RimI-like enzyme
VKIIPIPSDAEPILWQFLAIAAHEPVENGVAFVKQHPIVSRYVQNFGGESDCGFFVCSDQNSDEPIGAIWARILPEEAAGYGFIDENTPEIAVAVRPEFHNQGVGKLLLRHFIEAMRRRFVAVSLNVRDDNLAAIALYGGAGFKRVKGSEVRNRAGGVSFTMILKFAE